MSDELLTQREVAAFLHTSDSTVKLWRDSRGLPMFKIGKRVYCYRDELLSWVEGQRAANIRPEVEVCEHDGAATAGSVLSTLSLIRTGAGASPSAAKPSERQRPEPPGGESKSERDWSAWLSQSQ